MQAIDKIVKKAEKSGAVRNIERPVRYRFAVPLKISLL